MSAAVPTSDELLLDELAGETAELLVDRLPDEGLELLASLGHGLDDELLELLLHESGA
jgi:hypothetical protein